MEENAPELPKLKLVRLLFLTQEGMPKKEYRTTVDEIFEDLHIKPSKNSYMRRWQYNVMYAVLSRLTQYFADHNVLFVRARVDGVMHYCLTKDEDLRENSIIRLEKRVDTAKKLLATQRQIVKALTA